MIVVSNTICFNRIKWQYNYFYKGIIIVSLNDRFYAIIVSIIKLLGVLKYIAKIAKNIFLFSRNTTLPLISIKNGKNEKNVFLLRDANKV